MSQIFTTILDYLQTHNQLAYVFLFVGSFLDTLIGPSFFLYGEFIFLPGAILAGVGVLNIWLVAAVSFAGGLLGDSTSFVLGKKYGKKIIAYLFKPGNKYLTPELFDRATASFQKRGVKLVFFARFLGPISWVTPFLAGVFDVKYTQFIKYNIPGVILGISQFLVAGYFLGFSYQLLLNKIEAFIVAAITIAIVVLFLMYRKPTKL